MNKDVRDRVRDDLQNKKQQYLSLDAIFSMAFAFLASLLAAFITASTGFDISIFLDPGFYISTAVSFILMMYTFTLVKKTVINSLKKKEQSDYKKNVARETYLNKYIHDNNITELVDEAVAEENEIRRIASAQHVLNSVTYGLHVEDLEDFEDENNIALNQEEFNSFVKKRGMLETLKWYQLKRKREQKRYRRRLTKAIRKVLNGKYSYDRLTPNDLLVAINDDSIQTKQVKINEAKEELRENKNKAITFVCSTAVLKSLIYDGVSASFWISLLTEIVLIGTSMINAYIVAIARINKLTLVISNRNEFLYNAIKEHLKNKPLGTDIGS